MQTVPAVVIDHAQQKMFVDGVEFPWFIHDDGPTVVAPEDEDDTTIVLVPILVASVDEVAAQ